MARILFVKTSSLGDVVHHCPAVSDAARALPGAQIDWVVEEPFAGVAAMHPAVRRVIPVAVRRWRSALWKRATWGELRALRRALAGERYDAIVDSQSLLKSALVARMARGTRHGMDRSSAREPLAASLYDVTHAVPRECHAVERNRRLSAQALGYPLAGSADYGLRPPPADSEVDEPYAVLLTMTSRADKLWPEPRWVELGRAIGTAVVLPWGTEAERSRAQRIASAIGRAIVPSERLSFSRLASLFARSTRVVGLDTGLTHLAAALGVPTTGLYAGSDPALTGLYGAARATNLGDRGRPPEVGEVLKSVA